MTDKDAKIEEGLRKLEEANKKLAAQRATPTTSKSTSEKSDKSFIGIHP
jgi:hypothetical protein